MKKSTLFILLWLTVALLLANVALTVYLKTIMASVGWLIISVLNVLGYAANLSTIGTARAGKAGTPR